MASSTLPISKCAQATPSTPRVDPGVASRFPKCVHESRPASRRASTGSMGSLVDVEREHVNSDTPPTSDEGSDAASKPCESEQPPTPISSEPCEVQKDGEAAENGMPAADTGFSIAQALRNFVRPKSTFSSHARRHQSLPVSSVTRNSVPAAHISNPTSSTQSPRPTSPSSPPLSEHHESSVCIQELSKLTLDAAHESREKNTPPLTPRALSSEDKVAGARSPRSNVSATASDDGAGPTTDAPSKRSEPLPATGPLRGKLSVDIVEGRGLRPAIDPYCVCVFEWNEYISLGPKHDQMDLDENESDKKASIPIRRTDSDMGRPMAIPMKSRQSSTNGSDGAMQRVTDPQWDISAVL